MNEIDEIRDELILAVENSNTPAEVLKSVKLKNLYKKIGSLPPHSRASYGQAINALKNDIALAIKAKEDSLDSAEIESIDITAPFNLNQSLPQLLPIENIEDIPKPLF